MGSARCEFQLSLTTLVCFHLQSDQIQHVRALMGQPPSPFQGSGPERLRNFWDSSYLAQSLHLTTEVDARRLLRSASTSTLTVPSTRRSTIGDRAFPVAAVCAWNSLSSSVRTVSSLKAFRDDLKTVLFRASFDDRT